MQSMTLLLVAAKSPLSHNVSAFIEAVKLGASGFFLCGEIMENTIFVGFITKDEKISDFADYYITCR